jgi:hypothetical protein
MFSLGATAYYDKNRYKTRFKTTISLACGGPLADKAATKARAVMRSFTIAFEGDSPDDSKQIKFEAEDAGRAFFILEREGAGRTATLSEGGRQLGVLRRAPTGFWQSMTSGGADASDR